MGADHLPADVRKAHPGLALAADLRLAAHLELEVHGGDVAAERQDLEAPAELLGAGPGWAAHAMGVDLVEAVAVLAHRVADRVRAIPEAAVEDVHVLVDQRLLVALEQRAHLGHDVGEIGREIAHAAPCQGERDADEQGIRTRGGDDGEADGQAVDG